MITRLSNGRHCRWWAEKTVDPPSPPRQQILRGFPAQGIPFPKEIDPPRCDVCPHPKPIKRGPLPGWFSYGTDRRKAQYPDPPLTNRGGNHLKVHHHNEAYPCFGSATTPSTGMPNVQTRNKKKKKKEDDDKDEIVRHNGHFKVPERKRVVSYVKQYQRRDRDAQTSSQQESEKLIGYGGDSDLTMLSTPSCGVNCDEIRQNLYKAVDELMSKQPEVVRIRPRKRLTELLELQQLGTLLREKKTSTVTKQLVEEVRNDQKIEASTQTQSPPLLPSSSSVVVETLSLPAPTPPPPTADVDQFEKESVRQRTEAVTPSVVSLLIQEPSALPALEEPAHSQYQIGPPQHRFTNLLFPQPRVATPTPVPEGQGRTATKDKNSTEWKQMPRDPPRILYNEKMPATMESSSSLESREIMQTVRERQRERYWERAKVNSAIVYQDFASKPVMIRDVKLSSHDQRVGNPADLVRERGEGTSSGRQIGLREIAGEKPQKENLRNDEPHGRAVDLKMLNLNSSLERLNLEASQPLQDRKLPGVGGLWELLKSAEEFERGYLFDSKGEQHFPVTIPSTELEYMKAAILNHNFYPRLVSSFIEQHAAGAPPETVAKLEQVRWRVMESWNPNNSVECDEKIRKYQDILTKFESELEKPFQEAMNFSYTLENMFEKPVSHAQKRKYDGVDIRGEEEEEEELKTQAMFV